MTNCRHTRRLVEAALSSASIADFSPPAHASACPACLAALRDVAGFDLALGRAARSLVIDGPMRMDVGDLPAVPARRTPMRGALIVAMVATVVVTVALLNWTPPGQHLGGVGPGSSGDPIGSEALDADAVAHLLGISPEDVVYTEDGALALTERNGWLELVLLRPIGSEQAERLILGAKPVDPQNPGRAGGATVLCPPELGLTRSWYVFGPPSAEKVELRVEHHAVGVRGATDGSPTPAASVPPAGRQLSTGAYLFAIVAPTPELGETFTLVVNGDAAHRGDGYIVEAGLSFPDGRNPRVPTPAGCWMHR